MTTLAEDILHAVKCGGLDSPAWRPACEVRQQNKAITEHEAALQELFLALGNDQLTTKQLASRMGYGEDKVRSRMKTLMDRKLVRRTTGLIPFKFFKAEL